MAEPIDTVPAETAHRAEKPSPQALRAEIDRAVGAGEHAAAVGALQRLWLASPDPATANFVVTRYEKLKAAGAGGAGLALTPARVALLRSFTVEPVVPLLRAGAFTGGIDLAVHVGEFNAYGQEMLSAGDRAHAFLKEGPGAQVVVLAVQARDIVPDLVVRFTDLSEEQVQRAVAEGVEQFRSLFRAFRAHSSAALVVHALAAPTQPAQGVLDAQAGAAGTGQAEAIRAINRGIAGAAREFRDVYVLDYPGLVARYGSESWHDDRRWLTTRLPISAAHLNHMAREWLRFIHPLAGKVCKAIVCDLDNTLWGGVIGEDGMTGIRLDQEYPGAAHQRLQRAVLDLYNRGVIVCVNSKNNEADAREALEKHPGMLLRPHHFAALRINWQDKATNLREIAEELNIGVDALCFIDDNPVERQWVRENAPEVTVLELPDDPMGYERVLRDTPVFERLALTAEDRARGRMYAEERQRTEFEKSATGGSATNLSEFYTALRMTSYIGPVDAGTLARVSQLTQKTNQFNLTTRRYSEQQILEIAAQPGQGVYWIRLTDRFGDNGIIGIAVLRCRGAEAEVDTFLLSCRVIGRGVETGFLSYLAERARERGATTLWGMFIPTKKNAPSRDFYKQHGFTCVSEENGAQRWEIDLSANPLAWPEWVARG